MQRNNHATNRHIPSLRLTPPQVNNLLNERFGVEWGGKAKYARRIRKDRSTVTRLVNGEIRGELRKRLANFLGVTPEMLPRKHE